MPTTNNDPFIEDLYNAAVWLTYYDTIIESVYILLVSKPFRFRFGGVLSLLDEMFSEKA